MEQQLIRVQDFRGGLNDGDPTIIEDNQLSSALNVSYDKQGILGSRYGFYTFGAEVASTTMHSIYFSQFSTGGRHLLAGFSDGTVRKFNEGTLVWDTIKTGLTGTEKLSFATFKNEIYWTNGTDNVMSYDGATVSEHSLVQKGKYLIVVSDVAYMACIGTADQSVVFYSNANPADLKSAFPNYEAINEDDGEVITGINFLGATVVVGKTNSIWNLNIFADPVSIQPMDYSGGLASHRSIHRVENDLYFMSDRGLYSLYQRRGTVGSPRAISLTDDLQQTIAQVTNKASACCIYNEATSNFLLALDVSGDNSNSLTISRSVRIGGNDPKKGLTEMSGLNAIDFCRYIDADGRKRIIAANAISGQAIEVETGFSDSEEVIGMSIQTKTFDLGAPETLKTFPHVDVAGFISSGAEVDVTISLNQWGEEIEATGTIDGSAYDDSTFNPFGLVAFGTLPFGGTGDEFSEIDLWPYVYRIPVYQEGTSISIRLESDLLNSAFKLNKVTIPVISHPINVFANDFIA